MERTLASGLSGRVGETVRLAGWLHHVRTLSKVSFVLLRDRSGIAQVVVDDGGLRESVNALLHETVVTITGTVVANAQAPTGYELIAHEIEILSAPSEEPPFELRRPEINAQLPTLLDNAAVSLRHPKRRAVTQLAAQATRGFRHTLDALGFTEIFTPKVVASATESGANVFPIDWFGARAFLAQSPQFYKQTMVGVLERVYEVAPVFRAEPHDTVRHLAEYVSLDVEMGFIDHYRDVMAVLREALAGMIGAIDGPFELPVVPEQIPVVDFREAQKMMGSDPEPDLAPADERWLGEWALREHNSDFVFVAGYPMVKRPFYTHPNPDRPDVSNSFDLLFRGLELVTGGQRLHRIDDYEQALAGQDTAPFEGYLQAFRHGMPPHGGFAIGLERFVARITGAANVREVTLFPRDLHRLTP
ncbi:MAG: nondiscriminating aspartyl-tRNA synthetase [Actinomycetota bacterium]